MPTKGYYASKTPFIYACIFIYFLYLIHTYNFQNPSHQRF